LGPHRYQRPTVRLLRDEVEAAFRRDNWALVPQWGNLSSAYAGAALSNCVALLVGIDEARLSGEAPGARSASTEMVVRVVLRSLIEAWIVGHYLVFGGDEALDGLGAIYRSAVEKSVNAKDAYNAKVKDAASKARRSNRKVAKTNEGLAYWHDLHRDQPPKPLYDERAIPWRRAVDFDLSAALVGAQGDVAAAEMALLAIAERVDQLADERGEVVTAVALYEIAYRVASTFGAHTTLGLLDCYLDHQSGWLVRIRSELSTPPTAENFVRSALRLTGMLARKVMAMRGVPAPVAATIEALSLGLGPDWPEEQAGPDEPASPG
jgi:hypothetical protein